MAIKTWKITAEVDMCANKYESVVVKANSQRKAIASGKEKLLKNHFFVTNVECVELKDGDE